MSRPESNPNLSPREIYSRAIGVPEVEREQLLSDLCSGDTALRIRVEQLLNARGSTTDGLLSRAVGSWTPDEAQVETESPGGDAPGTVKTEANEQRLGSVGPYILIEVIGEGGMGTVYRARQTSPFEREVAVKLIKKDLQTPEVQNRFAKERRTLAMMEHPNIALLLDGGETEDGNQFFVMEIVRGLPLTDYSSHHDLSIEARLRLFIDLGRAVQHAHDRQIVHRDLKPSNVLVAEVDGHPLVKVIDFGIAKSHREAWGGDTLLTSFDQILGTPLYMAPELIASRGDRADARSDVYSLGVMLYELLCGSPPFIRETLAKVGYSGFIRLLEQQQFAPPSVRARSESDPPSERSNTSPRGRQLVSALTNLPLHRQRELDWIVLRALQGDPNGRYASVSALLDDLHCYLDQRPISAGPPNRLAQLRKWLSRRRSAMVLAGTILLAVTCGFAVSHFLSSTPIEPSAESGGSNTAWEETVTLGRAIEAFQQKDYALLKKLVAPLPNANGEIPPEDQAEAGNGFDLVQLMRDAASPQPLFQLPNSDNLQAADYSPQAQRFVLADREGRVYLLQLSGDGTPQPPTLLGRHPGRIDALAISPDGTLAVSGTDSLWYWNLEEQRLEHRGVWLDAGIETITWAPDGQTIAAGARYEATWIGDRQGRELFRVTNDHRHESLLFTPDSKRLLIPTREGIEEYDLASQQRVRTIPVAPLENVRTMCWAGPQKEWLVTSERFLREALVIDGKGGHVIGQFSLGGQYPQCLRANENGTCLASLYPDGSCELIRLAENRDGRVNGTTELQFVSISETLEDDSRIDLHWMNQSDHFLIVGGKHPASAWDRYQLDAVEIRLTPMELMESFPGHNNSLVLFPQEPDSVANRAYFLNLNSPSSNPIGDKLAESKNEFSSLSKQHWVACAGEAWIEIVDLKSGYLLARIEIPALSGELMLTLSQDGATVAIANDEHVYAWRTEDLWNSWSQVAHFRASSEPIAKLTDNGRSILIEDEDALLEIDLESYQQIHRYENANSNDVWHATTWEPPLGAEKSEKDLVFAATRNSILVWERDTERLLHEIEAGSRVNCFQLTKDGKILLTGNRDGTIRAWHLATRQPLGVLLRLKDEAASISRLELFPDSARLYATAKVAGRITPIVIGK